MCEETDREGRALENKWIYVLLLFASLTEEPPLFFFFFLNKYFVVLKNDHAYCCSQGQVHLKLIKRKNVDAA